MFLGVPDKLRLVTTLRDKVVGVVSRHYATHGSLLSLNAWKLGPTPRNSDVLTNVLCTTYAKCNKQFNATP